MKIDRFLSLTKKLGKKSHFLFGPRGVGKSFLIRNTLADLFKIDLLSDDIFSRLIRNPSLLSEIIPKTYRNVVVIDEIQKIPALLDEVHKLIEERRLKFLLTGSSARKIKRGSANLLGGRAWEINLFPFTYNELEDNFNLNRYLSFGGLPEVYFSKYPKEELKNYIKLYLREEIQAEGLLRKYDHFVRFLDYAALTSGEELNYDSLGSDSGVPPRTVSSYIEILEDTLVGFRVFPFTKSVKRKAISKSKFYLFDVGVCGAITKRAELVEQSELYGKAFEQFIAMELRAFLSYTDSDNCLCYWRTTSRHEVDFVIGDSLAIEVKSTNRVGEQHLKGLRMIAQENILKKLVLISRDPLRRITDDNIEIIPWNVFLDELWQGSFLV